MRKKHNLLIGERTAEDIKIKSVPLIRDRSRTTWKSEDVTW